MIKFIADKSNPIVAKFSKIAEEHDRDGDEKVKFLNKQMEALNERREQTLRAFFDELKSAGLIEPECNFEDYELEYMGATDQVFLKRKINNPLVDLFKTILSGD